MLRATLVIAATMMTNMSTCLLGKSASSTVASAMFLGIHVPSRRSVISTTTIPATVSTCWRTYVCAGKKLQPHRLRAFNPRSLRAMTGIGQSSHENMNNGPAEDLMLVLLRRELFELGTSAESFDKLISAADAYTIEKEGFDTYFGKSAIKAFRSYVKREQKRLHDGELSKGEEDPAVTARRTAIQIDFLAKRHRSRVSESVRCVDEAKKQRRTFPFCLVLDNLRSAFNVGSIYRTADAAGVAQVITVGYTPRPQGSGAEKLAKSALGAQDVVPTVHFQNINDALNYLRKEGYDMVVGMETTENSLPYTDVKYSNVGKGTALILGNEVTGVNTEIMGELDALVEIPMFGAKNSLNVAACAPVVLYEVLRQWNYDVP
mmetsp:Transcript_11398/g.17127  ORF Transcript_11398/g.17127 Transcript_11398/m.17127 type:complete len:376 (-) Transcript_11398:71-1198(-)